MFCQETVLRTTFAHINCWFCKIWVKIDINHKSKVLSLSATWTFIFMCRNLWVDLWLEYNLLCVLLVSIQYKQHHWISICVHLSENMLHGTRYIVIRCVPISSDKISKNWKNCIVTGNKESMKIRSKIWRCLYDDGFYVLFTHSSQGTINRPILFRWIISVSSETFWPHR